MRDDNRHQVLVAGAGPTGLMLALWLTRLGIAVRIIDKNEAAAPFSRALGVHARTLEFYQQLGFADEVVRSGVRVQGVNLWVKGKRTASLAFSGLGDGMTPFPFILDFAQDDHERLLIAKLEGMGVTVERRTELLRIEQNETAWRQRSSFPMAAKRSATFHMSRVVTAHSTVRENLAVGFPGGTYSRRFYVADVEASGSAVNQQINVGLDMDDLLAVFPMMGEGHLRLVGTVRDDATDEGHELSYADVSHRVAEGLKLQVGKVNWFSTYRVHHRVAGSFRRGRLFLLGDAAHVHSPVGAQGMNTGIGDAVNLAWKLTDVLNGAEPDRLLDSYETERIAFAQRLVATTDRAFTIASKPSSLAAYVRTRIFPAVGSLALRAPGFRRFFFRTVSQLAINYRSSSLSVGSAGRIRGGDRLPWIRAGETGNFEPLNSLNWQVHVYGKAQRGLEETCDTLRLPLHVIPWDSSMNKESFLRDALYLIRPDGYVGLADAAGNSQALADYFGRRRPA